MNNPNTNENIIHFQNSGQLLRTDFGQNLLVNNNNHSESSKGEQSNYKTGRWNNTEHMRFIQGCLLHGNNWRKVSLILSIHIHFFLIFLLLCDIFDSVSLNLFSH